MTSTSALAIFVATPEGSSSPPGAHVSVTATSMPRSANSAFSASCSGTAAADVEPTTATVSMVMPAWSSPGWIASRTRPLMADAGGE